MIYRFEAFRLRLECESPALARRADQVLRYHRFEPVQEANASDWTLRLTSAVVAEPDWPVALEAAPCRLRTGTSGWWLQYGAVAFMGKGAGCIGYVPEGEVHQPDFVYGLVLALCLLLRERGWFGLHGAGLVYQGQGILLIGRSDTGKSTLAYSLVRRGWHFLTDDALLVHLENGAVEAVSFRKDFGLDPESTRYFPELADCSEGQPTDPNKRRIQMERLYPGRFCARLRPVALVFPALTGQSQSLVHPLRRSEAFGRLLQASLLLGRADDPMERHLLNVMEQLVNQAPAYQLALGSDVLRQPERLEGLLNPNNLSVQFNRPQHRHGTL